MKPDMWDESVAFCWSVFKWERAVNGQGQTLPTAEEFLNYCITKVHLKKRDALEYVESAKRQGLLREDALVELIKETR